MAYGECWDLQRSLFDALCRKKLEKSFADDEPRGTILLVEHPAVYTLGKSGNEQNMLVTEEYLKGLGAEFYHIDRGGDVTFHGPGQLVCYPIIDLDAIGIGVRRYIEALEQSVIDLAKEYGIDAAITPHSCYTMSPQLLAMAAEEGLKSGFLSYHSQESHEEEELIRTGTGALAENYKGRGLSTPPVTGKPALTYFIDRLLSFSKSPVEGNVLLVHNVAIDQESIDYAKKHLANPYFAICPLSNIFIHRALPPLDLMRENGLKICLGTDSLSSNTILSIVKEIECIHKNFPQIPLVEILEWACSNGAEMLGKQDVLGSFEPGKKPGVVLLDNIDWENFKLTEKSTARRLV